MSNDILDDVYASGTEEPTGSGKKTRSNRVTIEVISRQHISRRWVVRQGGNIGTIDSDYFVGRPELDKTYEIDKNKIEFYNSLQEAVDAMLPVDIETVREDVLTYLVTNAYTESDNLALLPLASYVAMFPYRFK